MAKDEDPDDFDKSAWNLSQNDILLMAELWRKATRESLSGDPEGCFYTTKEIRFLIHTDLKDYEDEKLDELESEIQKLIGEMRKGTANARSDLGEKLVTYKKYMRELLGKYGYLFSKKDDSSKMF